MRVDIIDCHQCYADANQKETIQQIIEKSSAKEAATRKPGENAIADRCMASGVFVDGMLVYFTGPINEEDTIGAIQVADSARRRAMDR